MMYQKLKKVRPDYHFLQKSPDTLCSTDLASHLKSLELDGTLNFHSFEMPPCGSVYLRTDMCTGYRSSSWLEIAGVMHFVAELPPKHIISMVSDRNYDAG